VGYQWSDNIEDSPLWLTGSICYDATDILLAAALRGHSDVFAIPALNQDVTTFDQMAFGLTVEGGVIWHDLRRTFATELRGRQVHEYDIADLLGHTIQSVTGTPEALEDAVNRLTEPRGSVIQFKRKAS